MKLDEPVNNLLGSWKIPANTFNKNNPVTVRQLLNMASGLSVSNFDGYEHHTACPLACGYSSSC